MNNYLDSLPDEILDIILIEYWYDYFKSNVIVELDMFNINIKHINDFLNEHYFIGFLEDDKFVTKLSIIENISIVLNKLTRYKCYRIMLAKNYKNIGICVDKDYINNCLSEINTKYKNVAALCINNCHPESRFNLMYKFSQLK